MATMGEYTCPHCSNLFTIEVSQYNHRVNRTNVKGKNNKVYCSRECSWKARRTTKEEKVEAKRLYDIEYRTKNSEKIKKRMQTYNSSPAGRAMQKRNREKFKQSHLEYCRTPEYRA